MLNKNLFLNIRLTSKELEEPLMSIVSDVNATNWETEILQPNCLVVVEFWHTGCSWCKMLEPIFAEVAEEYKGKVKFAKLNVQESDQNHKLAVKYGVWGTPTLGFFCAGRLVNSITGFRPKEGLVKLVEENMEEHKECAEGRCTELKS